MVRKNTATILTGLQQNEDKNSQAQSGIQPVFAGDTPALGQAKNNTLGQIFSGGRSTARQGLGYLAEQAGFPEMGNMIRNETPSGALLSGLSSLANNGQAGGESFNAQPGEGKSKVGQLIGLLVSLLA